MQFVLVVLLLLSLAPCASLRGVAATAGFNNPILETLADPMMFRDVDPISGEATYYMAGTSFGRYKSKDMVHWERLANWSNINQAKNWPGSNNQSISGVWACEVARKGSTYYLYFSAVKPSGDRRVVYVATSGSIEGVFTIQPTPVIELSGRNAIDPHPFRDPLSGYTYLYYTQDQGTDPDNIARIYVVRMREDMLAPLAGAPHTLCAEAETQGWESRWMEGMVIREYKGWYYLFYSSRCYCSDGYALGYATANSPTGPWTKFSGNPVFQKASSALGKVSGPGHINLVKSPDGTEDWVVYHAHIATAAGGQRHTCIDRYRFEPNPGAPDKVVIDGPTLGLQPMPAGSTPLTATIGMDTFDNAMQLDRARWSKIREEDSAYHRLTGSQLAITPRVGSLFTDGVDPVAKNVILQKAPGNESWFAVTDISFYGIPGARQPEVHAGMVAWQDSRHYVAALMNPAGGLRLDLCYQTYGNRETFQTNLFNPPFPGIRYLRLAYDHTSRTLTFSVSADRANYTPIATVNSPLSDSRQTFAGLTAFTKAGTSQITGAEALFNWFHIDVPQKHHWPFDEHVQDLAGGLQSTAVGNAVTSQQHILGTGSLELDGNARLLLAPPEALQNPSTARTVSFWIKPRSLDGNQIVYEEGSRTNGFAIRLSGASVQAAISVASQITAVSLPGVRSNVWQFVTVAFDGTAGTQGSLAIYFSGQFRMRSDAPSQIPGPQGDAVICGLNGSYAFADAGIDFRGLIDDLRVDEGRAGALASDADLDGLPESQELAIGTNPTVADSDHDGVPDGFEVVFAGTDPLNPTDTFKVDYDAASCAFLVPSVSNFSFFFEQFNVATGGWSHRAGPFETGGCNALIPLGDLGFSSEESAVLLRVRVADPP